MEEIHWRFGGFEVVSLHHVDRESNKVADAFATFAVDNQCDNVLFHSIPLFAYDSMLSDVNNLFVLSYLI